MKLIKGNYSPFLSFVNAQLFAAILLLSILIGCDIDRDPSNQIFELPDAWGEENCQGDVSLKVGSVSGYTANRGYLWTALTYSDTICVYSKGFYIDSGQFEQSVMWMQIDPVKVPEGNYKIYAYFSEDSSEIGELDARLMSSGPYNFELSYSQVKGPVCVETILGDSTLFCIEEDGFGDKSIYIGSNEATPGYSWEMLLNNDSLDEQYFVQLADSGLYFPLKVSRTEEDLRWVLKTTNINDFNDTVIAEVLVRHPSALGGDNIEHDSLVYFYGHEFGIPPQIIKSIIRKETYFDNLKYRYELNFDYVFFQPAMDNNYYYRLYHLADSARTASRYGYDKNGDSVSQGDNVADLQTDPYDILRNYSLNPEVFVCDTVRDSLITGNELAQLNYRFSQHDSNFVAQIIINSSYGLMQPMHVSLIDFVSFEDKNPQSLLESENLAIYWGVKYFKYIYDNRTPTHYDWDTRWRTAIGKYNGGVYAQETYGVFENNDVEYYVQTVLGFVKLYQPQRDE